MANGAFWTRVSFGVLVLHGLLADCAPAQARSPGCFWPKAEPRCGSWFITEVGVLGRLTDRQPNDETILLALSVGWMKNTSSRMAWGGEFFAAGEGEARIGVAARGRRWLSPRVATDVVAGIHLAGDATTQDVGFGSPRLAVRISYAEIAAVARFDYLVLTCTGYCDPERAMTPNQNSSRFYLGGEVGGRPGTIAAVLAAVGATIAMIAYTSGES